MTNTVICSNCGGTGHIAKDCRTQRSYGGEGGEEDGGSGNKIDEEYMSLMAELGEGPSPKAENQGKAALHTLVLV